MNGESEARIELLFTNMILYLSLLPSVVNVTYLGKGTTVEELPPLDWRWAYPCSIFMIMHGCRRTQASVGGAIPRQVGLDCKGKVVETVTGSIPSVLFCHGFSFRTCLKGLPWLPFSDRLQARKQKKPFLPQFVFFNVWSQKKKKAN